MHDFDGKYLDANKAALHVLGYSEKDIHTTNFASLLGEDQLGGTLELDLSDGTSYHISFEAASSK